MTILNIIKQLQEAGYDISFYKRKDGGYRITRINGQRFTGSSGNETARKIVGAELSEARKQALMKLKTPKGKGSYNKRRKSKVGEDVEKRIRRIQRMYRKAGKKEGKPTRRNYRYIEERYGKEEAERRLRQAERRILGLAYVENVEALLLRVRMDLNKKADSSMESAYSAIEAKKYNFKDAWIYSVYEVLYDWERNIISGEEAKLKILSIIQ